MNNRRKLGELVDDIAMGPFGSNLKADNFISSGVPVIRGGNLNEGGFDDKNFVFVSEEKALSLKRSLAFPNDLVFTHRGTIGQVGLIKKGKYPYYLVSQSQVKLSVNKNFLDPKFLFYWFKSPIGQYELLKNSAQVGVPSIASPTKSLKEIDISIPPLTTQKAIAEILSSLDDKIELNNQINQNLEALAQAIFKQWFVDFEFPNENGEPYKSSGGEMVDSELGEIPKDWLIGKISDFTKTTSGGTPSRKILDYYENGKIRWVKSKELNNSMFFDTEEKITEEGLKNSSAKLLPPYSVLIAMYGATVGQFGLITKEATCNQAICAVLPSEILPYSFNYLFFQNYRKQFEHFAVGSAQQNISQELIKSISIKIPPKGKMEYFHASLLPLLQKIESNCLENNSLIDLRNNLLPKLISGELEVNESLLEQTF